MNSYDNTVSFSLFVAYIIYRDKQRLTNQRGLDSQKKLQSAVGIKNPFRTRPPW